MSRAAYYCYDHAQMCDHPHSDEGYAEGDEISTARLALLHDTGKMCAECGAEFTQPNGKPSVCEHCRNQGSDLPVSQHPEVNREAHRAAAQKRKARKVK